MLSIKKTRRARLVLELVCEKLQIDDKELDAYIQKRIVKPLPKPAVKKAVKKPESKPAVKKVETPKK